MNIERYPDATTADADRERRRETALMRHNEVVLLGMSCRVGKTIVKIIHGLLIAGYAASAAHAGSPSPAQPPEIIAGVQSCLAATGEKQIDINKLEHDGWSAMQAADGEGRPVKSPLPLLSKGDLTLLHQTDGGVPICAIMAKVSGVPAVGTVANGLDQALKVQRKTRDGKGIPAYWFTEGRLVELSTTGTQVSPGVRIVVAYRK